MKASNLIDNKLTHSVALGLMVAPVGVVAATQAYMTNTASVKTAHAESATPHDIFANGVFLAGTSPSGHAQYCMSAGFPDPYGAPFDAGSDQLDIAGNIAGLGPVNPGDTPLYHFQSQGFTNQQTAVQVAIWIALGEGNWQEGNHNGTVNQKLARMPQSIQNDVHGLLQQSNNGHNDLNAGYHQAVADNANVGSYQQSLQQSVNNTVSSAINSWAASAQNSVTNKVNTEAESQYNSVTNMAKSNALKAVHFTQDKTPTTSSEAARLPHFEDGKKNNHSDSVEYGAHVFDYTLTHDAASALGDTKHISNVDFGKGAVIKFDKALPKDTVIVNNGKTITKDASKSQNYEFNYGRVEIRIPFSDQPSTDSDNMNGTFTVKGHVQTDTFNASANSQINMNVSGATKGYTGKAFTEFHAYMTGRQTFAMDKVIGKLPQPQSFSASAAASSAVSATAERHGDFTQQSSVNLKLNWDSLLTNFVIHKTDERNTPLRGVTFELVQSSVANSDILKSGPGKYVLATDDNQLISLPKISDKKGEVRWDYLPYGKYELLEIQTNNNHVIDSNPIDLTADRYHVDDQLQHVINDHGKIKISSHAGSSQQPSIHTTATGTNGTKLVLGAGVQNITDTVTYTGLKPNTTYHMVGQFMDQATGQKIDGLHGQTTFKTGKETNGTVQVQFSADASKFAGKNIVAFETLYNDNNGKPSGVVATHTNIHDSGQTVRVTKPAIHTTATVDGKKSIAPNGTVNVTDTVKYEGLVPGVTMNMNGQIMNKDNGKAISDTSTKTFTPKGENGTVDVNIKTDASKMGQKGMVAFETLKDQKGQTIAVHHDINDNGQTINRLTPAQGRGQAGTPAAPLARTAMQTAENNIPAIALLASAMLLAGSGLVYTKSRKRD